MTRANEKLTRRAALRRLGLAVGAAYCSPMLTGMSSALAGSPASSSSNPTPPSDPTAPTAPSTPTAASAPSSPSGSEDDGREGGRGECSAPSGSERIEISRRDMQLANEAVAQGEAKPLREIFEIVQGRHPGRMIRVGFDTGGGTRQYWLRMVTHSGSLQTVTVDAFTGATMNVRGC